jgi:uncharacterized protein YdiU (UPF0061 family)
MASTLVPATPLVRRPVGAPFAALGPAFGTPVAPTPLPAPRLVHVNETLAATLGVATDAAGRERLAALVAGAHVPDGWTPFASAYAGHQFGVFVPRLGDGRALVLGTIVGDDGTPHELQLKGGGPTPYSRGGDGRAVLRSTIREYVACEAMHALGIPTSRALAMVASPAPVLRERPEPAAAMIRTAPTHVRFGTFEWLAVQRDVTAMATLVHHVCDGFLPEVPAAAVTERAASMLHAVADRTARLLAQWMGVGFVHTVMNTDNMSVLGLTIDYGPYAFMEGYDPAFTPNHSDPWGRYAYGAQPAIARWNLERLADALALVAPRASLDAPLAHFERAYDEAWTRTLHAKLGFARTTPGTRRCAEGFLSLLAEQRADFTRAFRALASVVTTDDAPAPARDEFAHPPAFDRWCVGYRAQLRAEASDDERRTVAMRRANPRLVPRTHVLQHAIEAAEAGDDGEVARLVAAYADPWSERDGDETLLLPGPADGHALSCSS